MDRKYSVGHDRNAKKNDRRYFENTQESPHESNEHRISCLKANPYPKLHLGHSTISRTIILGVASLIGEKLVVEVGAEEAKVLVHCRLNFDKIWSDPSFLVIVVLASRWRFGPNAGFFSNLGHLYSPSTVPFSCSLGPTR